MLGKLPLLVLIGIIAATSLQEEAEVTAKLQQIESTSFGRYVIDFLQVQMETSDSLDYLVTQLEKLESRYESDQKEDDANNRSFQNACDYNIKEYDTDLANTNYQKLQLEAKLEGDLLPNRAVLQGVEKAKLHEVKEYKEDLAELDKEREEQNAVYEEKLQEHREASRIIREAKAILQDNLEKPSLIELKKNKHAPMKVKASALAQISQTLTVSIADIKENHKYTKGYASLFKVLLTIASKIESTADQDSVAQIINLCQNLIEKIDNSSDLERFAEDKRVQAWQKHRALINRDLNSAISILANIQAQIASYNDQIEQVHLSLQNVQARIDNLEDMRGERYTECEQAAFDYKSSRSARDRDRQVVSDVIGLVNQHMRALREQMALRLAAGDKI